MDRLDNLISAFLSGGFNTAYNILIRDLASYLPGILNFMQQVNESFTWFAASLTIMLTIWNMCRNSIRLEELKRPETLIRALFRMILTYFAVTTSWDIVCALMTASGQLISVAFTAVGMDVGITAENFFPVSGSESWWSTFINTVISLVNFSWIIELILFIAAFCVAVTLSVKLVLTVMTRYFKIYLLAAVSPIPLAFFAADDTENVGRGFVHTFIAVCMEGLVIALAMIVFIAYMQSGVDLLDMMGVKSLATELNFGGLADIGGQILNMLILEGLIKGADELAKEIISR